MFLDEELLKIGRETELTDEGIYNSVSKMINVCFNNLSKGINGRMNKDVVIPNFKRVNNTWHKVTDTLEKEGRGFIKRDGFKLFVENKPEFNGIFFS